MVALQRRELFLQRVDPHLLPLELLLHHDPVLDVEVLGSLPISLRRRCRLGLVLCVIVRRLHPVDLGPQALDVLPLRRQLALQALDHVLELLGAPPDVHLDLVLDVLGALAEPESGQCLLDVAQVRGAAQDQHRLRVAAQTLLQNSRQLGVPVRNVGVPIAKRFDHVGQASQRQVDLLRLLKGLPDRIGLVHPLASRQIHEGELPRFGRSLLVLLDEGDLQNRVRPRRTSVHVRGRHCLVGPTDRQHVHQAVNAIEILRAQALDVDPPGLGLVDLEVVICRLEQVLDLLLVQLKVAGGDGELPARGRRKHEVEELADRLWDDPPLVRGVNVVVWAEHGVRLARGRLAVRENRPVVSLEAVLHDVVRDPLEDLVLRGVLLVDPVQIEVGLLLPDAAPVGLGDVGAHAVKCDGRVPPLHVIPQRLVPGLRLLALVPRPEPGADPNVLRLPLPTHVGAGSRGLAATAMQQQQKSFTSTRRPFRPRGLPLRRRPSSPSVGSKARPRSSPGL